MDDRINESLSALMDGEADELEIQRVLRASADAQVRATWTRYQLTSAVIRELSPVRKAPTSAEFAAGVMAALAVDEAHSAGATSTSDAGSLQTLLKPVASLAIAASVAGAVVIGGQWLDAGARDPAAAAPVVAGSTTVAAGSWGGVPIAASIRLGGGAKAAASDQNAIYDALARERLQRYMLHNAEHAALNNSQGLMSFARVTSQESN